jgi:hypothetical protein
VDKHSSDSRFNGWGVSCTRNFDLWNLYNSEFEVLERRGVFDFDIVPQASLPMLHNANTGRCSVVSVHGIIRAVQSGSQSSSSVPAMIGTGTAPGLLSATRLTTFFVSTLVSLSSGSNYVRYVMSV